MFAVRVWVGASAAPAVREAVQEGRGHFGVAKDARPFAESEIGGDDDGSALVEPADQMKEELPGGPRTRPEGIRPALASTGYCP